MRPAFLAMAVLLAASASADIYFSDEGPLLGPVVSASSGGGSGGGGGGGAFAGPRTAPTKPCTEDCTPTAVPDESPIPPQALEQAPSEGPAEAEPESSAGMALETPAGAPKTGSSWWVNALLLTLLGALVAGFVVLATLWDSRGRERFYHARKLRFGSAYFITDATAVGRIALGAARFDPVLLLAGGAPVSSEKNLLAFSISQAQGENAINPSEIELLNEKAEEFMIGNAGGVIVLDCLDLIIEGTNRQSAMELIRIIKAKLGTAYMLIVSTRNRTRAEELREPLQDLFDEWR